MRAILFLLPMLASACSAGMPDQPEDGRRAEAPAAAAEVEQTGPADVLAAPTSLIGQYRVAGVDGEPLNADYGIALSIGPDRISFDNCQQIAWRYAFAEGELTTSRTSAAEGEEPPCAAPLPPAKQAMVQAIDVAARAGRTEANGILISGEGRSITLFSQ